ncbi:hypothetical protein A3Q56_02338 [Intoshia linei]|uniref:Protein-tyrosine-phosphatase n=1 Tax=Intoshia linei TaxID=1819745 RepID=A0A177B6M8_9BILA|nr:hypothetical protein A3Q56_02338 [Intoshia linei]
MSEKTRLADILEYITWKTNISDVRYFGLQYVDKKNRLQWITGNKTLKLEMVEAIEMKLHFKVLHLTKNQFDDMDLTSLHFIFMQLYKQFTQGEFIIDSHKAIYLLGCLIRYKLNQEALVDGLKICQVEELNIFPIEFTKDKFLKNQIFKESIKIALHLKSYSLNQVKLKFLKFCQSLKGYGCTYFAANLIDQHEIYNVIISASSMQLSYKYVNNNESVNVNWKYVSGMHWYRKNIKLIRNCHSNIVFKFKHHYTCKYTFNLLGMFKSFNTNLVKFDIPLLNTGISKTNGLIKKINASTNTDNLTNTFPSILSIKEAWKTPSYTSPKTLNSSPVNLTNSVLSSHSSFTFNDEFEKDYSNSKYNPKIITTVPRYFNKQSTTHLLNNSVNETIKQIDFLPKMKRVNSKSMPSLNMELVNQDESGHVLHDSNFEISKSTPDLNSENKISNKSDYSTCCITYESLVNQTKKKYIAIDNDINVNSNEKLIYKNNFQVSKNENCSADNSNYLIDKSKNYYYTSNKNLQLQNAKSCMDQINNIKQEDCINDFENDYLSIYHKESDFKLYKDVFNGKCRNTRRITTDNLGYSKVFVQKGTIDECIQFNQFLKIKAKSLTDFYKPSSIDLQIINNSGQERKRRDGKISLLRLTNSEEKLVVSFKSIPINVFNMPTKIANCDQNIQLNRSSILPYDFNLVGTMESYISASYIIEHIKNSLHYICTQHPMQNSFNHFWRLVLTNNVDVILMLNEFGPNYKMYFPLAINATVVYGNISITLLSENKLLTQTNRSFVLKCNLTNKQHIVWHIHYHHWDEMDIPASTNHFINFLDSIDDLRLSIAKDKNVDSYENIPVVIHCDYGASRSGLYLLVDLAKRSYESGLNRGLVDILYSLRRQRMHILSYPEQFVFSKRVLSTLKRASRAVV